LLKFAAASANIARTPCAVLAAMLSMRAL